MSKSRKEFERKTVELFSPEKEDFIVFIRHYESEGWELEKFSRLDNNGLTSSTVNLYFVRDV